MRKGTWYSIGVMSGTSLDGVDLAYVKFTYNTKFSFEILVAETIVYSDTWKDRLTSAFTADKKEIKALDESYGRFLGVLVNDFVLENKIQKLDYVASHGHTIFHKPEKGYTLQIGDGATIARTCNKTVVCDFRTQDVALGGQGAPLVPIGDALLFSEYDYCLNIGGFANISFDDNGVRKAYDICPANIVLNHYTRKMGLEFDDRGSIAKSGNLHMDLLQKLDTLAFYSNKSSLGNEIVVSEIIPLIDSFSLPFADILHTYTVHFSRKISEEFKTDTSCLLTGGGAFNANLVEIIKLNTKSRIILPSKSLIDYKEALIFALLGLLKIENEINCLASVTQASKNHSSGMIFTP